MTRALVTGGASGIGLATARLLAGRGVDVTVLDLDERVEAAHGLRAFQVDVRDEARLAAAISDVGPVELLVNAAGVYRIRPTLMLEAAAWDDVLAINLRGAFVAAREVVRAGAARAIVNVSSIAAFAGDRSEPAADYAASNYRLLGLTRQMAAEWGPQVRVNAVCPGLIDTPMLRAMDDPEAGRAFVDARVPLGRLGAAEEVATAVAYLLSDDASYITGVALPVDGGVTIS